MDFKKLFYNTVLSQTFSSCGKHLFVGNTFGDVFVFSVQNIFDADKGEAEAKRGASFEPSQVFKASEKHSIHSLVFHRNYLIVGTTGEISGYAWTNEKLGKKLWSVVIPSSEDSLGFADVNCLFLAPEKDLIYAGCGDNKIYCISLDRGQIVRDFSEHKDYIHCVFGNGDKLFSASEDGLVNIWDLRQKKLINSLEPHTQTKLERPHFGKWVGTVCASDDWLVCGGGPKASLWHLRTLECTTVFPFPDKVHVSGFLDETIMIAGHHDRLFQFNFTGTTTAEIPLSASAVYSVVWQMEPLRMMSIAGTSNEVDICQNFNYKDIVLKLYGNNSKNSVNNNNNP